MTALVTNLPALDLEGVCKKCGGDEISVGYQTGFCRTMYCQVTGEHLHRVCARCHYQWPEATLDATRNE